MVAVSDNNELYSWGKGQKEEGIPVRNRFMDIVNYQSTYESDQIEPNEITTVPKTDKIMEISAWFHAAIVTSSGSLYVWGDNADLQLGVIITYDEKLQNIVSPVRVDSKVKFTSVSCGYSHTIALGQLQDHAVVLSWGGNEIG